MDSARLSNPEKSVPTYPWPGNAREMKNALEGAFTVADKDTIDIDHLPPQMLTGPSPEDPVGVVRVAADAGRRQLVDALRTTEGNQSQAARILGISRVTVWNRMRKYGIQLKRDIAG